MKKILKLMILLMISVMVLACTPGLFGGVWENTVTNDDNTSKVITTLTIVETDIDSFTGTMTAKVEGKESTTLKVPLKNISFSGYISGKNLRITQVDEVSEYLGSSSSFRISENGKYLTLNPGGLKFTKK